MFKLRSVEHGKEKKGAECSRGNFKGKGPEERKISVSRN